MFPTGFHFGRVRLTGYAPCRGAIRREKRNDTRVVPYKVSFWVGAFDGLHTLQGESVGNDPRVVPHQSTTNLNHFYPVAERVKTSAFRWRNAARSSRSSQHGIRLHSKSVQRKIRINNPIAVKVLKVLRGLLLKKSPKRGLGQSPKVSSHIIHKRGGEGEENDMQKAD